MAASAVVAAVSAARSSSDPFRVLVSPATISRSDAPSAAASAAADPPPGVGSGALNTERRSRSGRSMSFMNHFPFFHDGANRLCPDADQIDGRAVDDHGVHLLAGLEAADPIVAVERV